jgi:hypothetical protein
MRLYFRAPNSIFFPLHNGTDKMFIAFVGFSTKENVCNIKMCNLRVIGKTNSLKYYQINIVLLSTVMSEKLGL